MSLYLQYLIDTSNHFSVVESAFYGIKWAHQTAGLKNPCESDIVRSILDASKRIRTRPIKKKTPVGPDIIKRLFNMYNKPSRTLKDLRLLSMCALAYTGFLRYNELCDIKAKNISFTEKYLDIFIEKSKTDCYRKGKNVYISKLSSSFCPVKILQSYLTETGIDMDSDMYIFRSLSFLKKSNSFVLRSKNKKLSYTRARELIREALSNIGCAEKEFGLHSFRSGGATMAAKYGISDRLFKMHGRWKSDQAKDGYVSEDLNNRLSVSKNLGI